ncbi:hypothetical protein [Oceanobacillus chungangensis]|uniref:Uncharacterized protein n=1 Tax=Oceanobacillus chungangensis TaxID=1229152 RepID=A0A3D8PRB4_9BACI|nr:hypothetical protein [Oceanobacillus chungangensis]RDW17709.1 hypothetical protein CWR45_10240 [Oceanobacillus chungangensis]
MLLTGCNFIGEDYDYTPPTVSLSYSEIELEEANINWNTKGDTSEDGTVSTNDIFELANEQEQSAVKVGGNDSIQFDNQHFLLEDVTVLLWKDGQSTTIEIDEKSLDFNYPSEAGNYVIDVTIDTDSGMAQYVGNILVD